MPIYNGTQKISMSGIDKVYVGTTLVYQKTPPVTITYRKAVYQGTIPATKVVPAGYQLTSADLPTGADGTWTLEGWTYDGTTQAAVGDAVTTDITLKSIHKRTYTTASLFKRSSGSAYSDGTASKTVSASAVSMGNVGNASSSTSSNTYALSCTKYSHTFSNAAYTEGTCYVVKGAWGGLVLNGALDHAARIE